MLGIAQNLSLIVVLVTSFFLFLPKVSAAASYREVIQSEDNLLYYYPMDEVDGSNTISSLVGSSVFNVGSTTTLGVPGRIDGTAILFDNTVNSAMSTALDFSSHNKIVVEAVINYSNPNVATNRVWAHGNTGVDGNGFLYRLVEASDTNTSNVLLKGNVWYSRGVYSKPAPDEWHHIVTVFDTSKSTNEVDLYVNGVLRTPSSRPNNSNNTGNFGNFNFNIGSFEGKMQHLAIYSDLSAEDITAHAQLVSEAIDDFPEDYISYEIQAEDLWDNGYSNVGVPRQSAYSRFIFSTNADTVIVRGSSSSGGGVLGWRLNGINQPPLSFSGSAVKDFILDLGNLGTEKKVEIITGSQESGTGVVRGTYMDWLAYPNTTTFNIEEPAYSNRIVMYGDSITVGSSAVDQIYNGFTSLLKYVYDFEITIDAWGWRSLYDDANTPGLRTGLVNHIVSEQPSTIYLNIGTNDYGLNKWNANNFGTAYAALLDDLHGDLPSARIICQTPIIRGNNGANSFGNTLSQYRDQITSACSARNWTTLIDGLTLLDSQDLSEDNLHPSTEGHAKYAKRVAPILSQPSFTISGPTSGIVSEESDVFTVTLENGAQFLGDQTITISDGDEGGTFVSSVGTMGTSFVSVTPSDTSTFFTFTYTPTSIGSKSLIFTNGQQGWTNPSAITYASSEAPILGCIDPSALNYNPLATQNDGSCEYEEDENTSSTSSRIIGGFVTCTQTTITFCRQLLPTTAQTEQIQQLNQTVFSFTRNLSIGMSGEDIKQLQKYLNSQGFIIAEIGPGSPGNETNFFGRLTKIALSKYQASNKISPAVGFFGPITRRYVMGVR